jgi:hypothetical protein
MNAILTKVLADWEVQIVSDGDELVFPSPKSGEVFNNVRRAC